MGCMAFDFTKWELRIYQQTSGYDCRLWEWKVWRGSELGAQGTVEGSEADARRAGEAALKRLEDAEDD